MVLFGLIAAAPSPFKKLEPKTYALTNQTTTTQKVEAKPEAPQIEQAKPVEPKPFDANDASTWPVCPENQWVWADDGKCHEKPAQQASVAQASTPATPIVTAAVNYGSHTDMLAAAGIAQSDWSAADYIVMHEGHYCPTIWNGETGCPAYHGTNHYKAYGVCQALSPEKMASAGADWETNPITQLRWCDSYAKARFGGWGAAYNYWLSHGNW